MAFCSYTLPSTTNHCVRIVNFLRLNCWCQFTIILKIMWNFFWCHSVNRKVKTMAMHFIVNTDQPNVLAIEFSHVYWMPSIMSKMRPYYSLTVKCDKIQILPAKRYELSIQIEIATKKKTKFSYSLINFQCALLVNVTYETLLACQTGPKGTELQLKAENETHIVARPYPPFVPYVVYNRVSTGLPFIFYRMILKRSRHFANDD